MRYVWLSVGAEPEKGLHSTSTVHVLHMLRRLAHDGMDVDIDAPTSVLCIRCYRLLDKCTKLIESSEVNTPVQRKRSSDNRGDLVGNQLSRACSAKD